MIFLKWSLFSFAALYLTATAGLGVFQRKLQYLPDRHLTVPQAAGFTEAEELRISTVDGESLVAWHRPPAEGRPVILYFHGNAGALVDRASRFRAMAARGYGLLAIAYRGYGGSTGEPTQQGLMRDAEAAYLEARARGYDPRRIVIVGESLGSGVAIALAAAREAAALVLDSPFSSAVDVAEMRYGLFPVRWVMLDQFRSDIAIRDVRIPLLIVHGDGDGVVPIHLGERLFGLANQPKTFLRVPGGKHLVLGLEDVFPRVCAWIDDVLGVAARD
jgi:fermentation-respiration switch protein FrsA (DUF1100 family)